MSALNPSDRPQDDPSLKGQDGSRRPALIPEAWLDGVVGSFNGAPTGGTDGIDAMSADEAHAFERGKLVASWLQRLPSVSAPAELEGRIVAAMHSGFRQDRATSALGDIAPLAAPAALDAMVAKAILATEPQPRRVKEAPASLDELVEQRLRDSEAAMVKGMTGRLDAKFAPEGLDRQMERKLDGGRSRADRSAGREGEAAPMASMGGSTPRLGMVLAAAAAAALFILGAGRMTRSAGTGAAASTAGATVAAEESPSVAFTIGRITNENVQASDRAVLGALGIHVPEGNS